MLSKEKRIKNTSDFNKVYQKGAFFYHYFFNLNFLRNRSDFSRFGFVVGKKATKKAVLRNSIKRKFREATRLLYDKVPKGYDIVINIKKEALELSQEKIKIELEKAFWRIDKNEKNGPRSN